VGPDTPPNKVLWGIKPQGATFKYEYCREFETEFLNISGCEFGYYMGSIRGKTTGQKPRSPVPFIDEKSEVNYLIALFL
jgi:hypothetical protein